MALVLGTCLLPALLAEPCGPAYLLPAKLGWCWWERLMGRRVWSCPVPTVGAAEQGSADDGRHFGTLPSGPGAS